MLCDFLPRCYNEDGEIGKRSKKGPCTAAFVAAFHDNNKLLEDLVLHPLMKRTPDPEERGNNLERHLHTKAQAQLGWACFNGHTFRAQEALDEGADAAAPVFAIDGRLGGTRPAAYVAAARGHGKILEDVLLPVPDVDPHKGDTRYGDTLMHAACAKNRVHIVTMLLLHGADLNRPDKDGTTACMWACFHGHEASLRALGGWDEGQALFDNAVATAGRFKGMAALDIALERKHADAATFLRDELPKLRKGDDTGGFFI